MILQGVVMKICPIDGTHLENSKLNPDAYICKCCKSNSRSGIFDKQDISNQTKTTDEKNQLISEIMDNFDFKIVCSVMNVLNWVWAPVNKVPSIEEIKNHSKYLLEEAYVKGMNSKEKTWYVSCGGFRANFFLNEDQSLSLCLEFIVADWDTSS